MLEGHSHTTNKKRVMWAFFLTVGFMVAEAIGGFLSGSLTLIADAGHMLTDAMALALSWVAFKIGDRRADARRTYGYGRFQVIAAFLNGLSLFLIAAWICWEAVQRFNQPVAVLAGPMLVIAGLGLFVNIGSYLILQSGDRNNLNMRSAALHVMGDILGSVAAIVAAVVILATGWMPIDPILSVVVALLVLRAAYKIVRSSSHILMEGTPQDIKVAQLREDLKAHIKELDDIHHIHIWSLTHEKTLLTLHAVVHPNADRDSVMKEMLAVLNQNFGISHATIQIESSAQIPHAQEE